jgi:hypothetical protein
MFTQDNTPRTDPTTTKRRARAATPTQKLLTGTQVEAIFGIPYRSLYDLYLRKLLPAVRFVDGGRLWFRRADVESLIERRAELHT